MARMPMQMPGVAAAPPEQTVSENALVKNKRKRGKKKARRGKASSPTTVYRGGEKFESY